MKDQSLMIQDIDQPVFKKENKNSRWLKWLILGVGGLIGLIILLSLLIQSGPRKGEEKKKPSGLTPTLLPSPTKTSSPSGILRTKWQEIKKQLDSLDPQQSALQPPELDFNIGI